MSSELVPEAPPAPVSSLSLEELRVYRHRLESEEDRVSYWRRLVHARIDLLTAESRTGAYLDFDAMVRALGDTGSGRSRRALLRIRAAEPLPALPELSSMWGHEVDPRDTVDIERALASLRDAEAALASYRSALHARIDEATDELISRYRADPAAALTLLPAG